MSGIKLLAHATASGILKLGNLQNCVRSKVTAPIVANVRNKSNNNIIYHSNYLISRCPSRYISSNVQTQRSEIVKHLTSRLNELSVTHSNVVYGTYQHRATQCCFSTKTTPDRAGKSDTKASAAIAEADIFGNSSKLGLFAKFKLMYKQYWYVLIPVHVVTSIGWLGGFYYLSKSGVDVPALLQYIHLSETVIQKVQNSDMGHYAIAYLCYKVITPLRYAVTLGGTTISIKYLVQMGHIKPIPSKKQILQMYEQNKANRKAAKAEKENRPN